MGSGRYQREKKSLKVIRRYLSADKNFNGDDVLEVDRKSSSVPGHVTWNIDSFLVDAIMSCVKFV